MHPTTPFAHQVELLTRYVAGVSATPPLVKGAVTIRNRLSILIEEVGPVSVARLIELTGCSSTTIRKQLKVLHTQGLVSFGGCPQLWESSNQSGNFQANRIVEWSRHAD